MIRKPTDDDFREGDAVKALRETRKVTVEGSKGIFDGVNRLWSIWFVGIMIFGAGISLITATGGLALIPVALGGIWWWRSSSKDAARSSGSRGSTANPWQAAGSGPFGAASALQSHGDGQVAVPANIRQQGSIEADIGSVAQQAFVLFGLGVFIMLIVGGTGGGIAIIGGIVLVMLSVLVGSRIFGDRKMIEWDSRKVKVWHLLSEGEMQWSDVSDVSVEKAGRLDLRVLCQTGSRRNIVITAHLNRLGGPTVMRVPIRFMNLPQDEQEKLLRDLFFWRAAGNSIATGFAAGKTTARQESTSPPAPAITPLSDPRQSFDPDAIMANYLRQRQETLEAVGREDAAPSRPAASERSPLDQRPVFGRKRA